MAGSSFTAQIEDFRTRTMEKLRTGPVGALNALLTSLVDLSPVADPSLWKGWASHWNGAVPLGMDKIHPGMFKGNWLVGDGALPETVDYTRRDEEGIDTIARGYAALLKIDFHTDWRVFLANHVLYAVVLENGHSTQAPYGMAAKTALKFSDVVTTHFVEGGGPQ